MIRLSSLTSGSCGNAFYLEARRTRLLVDAGVTLSYLKSGLRAVDSRIDELTAVLITHEHSDHISALPMISRCRPDLPIYANAALVDAAPELFADINLRVFPVGSFFTVGEVEIQAFKTSHDSAAPVGFCFYQGRHKVGLATDLGVVTPQVLEALAGYDALMLEANHDVAMLERGRYPQFLKKRIRGRFGHISNDETADALKCLTTGRKQDVLLGHISADNNRPEVARATVETALAGAGIDTINLNIAPRRSLSPILTLA